MGKKLDVDGWTVNDIMDLYGKGELCVDQRYQRKLVWDLNDKTLFIDSLMKSFPIPNIMMVEYEDESSVKYGIIDGLQRINAIISFMLGEFPVEVNGMVGYFDINSATGTFDLSQEGKLTQKQPVLDRQLCIKFRSYKLPIIATSHNTKTIDEIFKRLNSTGTKLSRHDLRQAGALNRFSQLVREISSTVRGSKTLFDIVPLDVMPQISLSNKNLDYGINIENVFWRKHGILTEDLLRKSRDEEIVAILLGAFLLDRPISVISPAVLDNLYSENTEDGKIADEKIEKSYDNLGTLFVQVFNDINLMCDESGLTFSEILFINDRKKTDMFMLLFKVLLQVYFEGKMIGDYTDFAETLVNSKKAILERLEEKQSMEYLSENSAVKLLSDIIESHLVVAESDYSTIRNEVINRLNLASVETKYTEYKIGFTFFNTSKKYKYNEGKINFKNVSQIAKVASSMTNIERKAETPGMIIIGVSDDEDTYSDWNNYFKERAFKYNQHRVVGIDAESKVHYKSIDNMLNAYKTKVDSEPISDELKEDLKNYEIITINKKTLIVITVTATAGQLYDGKKYIRDGSDVKEITM